MPPDDSRGDAVRSRKERGYVLLVFIFLAALLLVSLSTILPKVAFEGQREKETELIFRGLQYERAIQLYVRKTGHYPNSLDDLDGVNGVRFLRKHWRDPMTKDGKWRLIHIGPGGVFVDSLTAAVPSSKPASGANPSQPGTASPKSSQQPTQPGSQSGASQAPFGGSSPSGSPTGLPPVSNPAGRGPAFQTSANPGANLSVQPRSFGQSQQTAAATQGGAAASSIFSSISGSPGQSSSPTNISGLPIAGVASTSKAKSIRVWNKYDEYDKWEFIYDVRQDPLAAAAMRGLTQQPTPGTVAQPGKTAQPGTPTPPAKTGQPRTPTSPSPFQQPGGFTLPGGFRQPFGGPGSTSPGQPTSPPSSFSGFPPPAHQ